MPRLYPCVILFALAACQSDTPPAESRQSSAQPTTTVATAPTQDATAALAEALAAQPAETRARYAHRHPRETLQFFGIRPGMTVVEALPGGGWYSKVLLDYLGPDGRLIGANYPVDIWPLFGFFSDERLEQARNWLTTWPVEAEAWRDDDSAPVSAFVMGEMPAQMDASADAVLFIRALHNLHRFEAQGGFLSQSLADTFRVLKPGGIVGVVQHEARPEMTDDFADGSHGYLKREAVIARIEQAGFEYVDAIEINANPLDLPADTDIVWRLPPTLATSGEDPVVRAEFEKVGESNRMTLRFRKPTN